MVRKVYKKLVRDKIPQIISDQGKKPTTRLIESDDEFLELLADKLVEEATEFRESRNPDELADVLEVLLTILPLLKISHKELEVSRVAKTRSRGGFKKRLFLDCVEE